MNDEDILELEKQCEKLEKNLGDNPANILYSEKTEKILSYRQKVVEIENDKEAFLFSLAGYKGETMDTLKKKTEAEIMSFTEMLLDEITRKPKDNG